MTKNIPETSLCPWIKRGVHFDYYEEKKDRVVVRVSVPERSEMKNADNQELCGYILAKQFRAAMMIFLGDVFSDKNPREVDFRYKVRTGEEMWTEAKGETVQEEFMEKLHSIME